MSEPIEDGADSRFQYGRRRSRVYPITELELQSLKWAPVWTRLAIIRRMMREVEFGEGEP